MKHMPIIRKISRKRVVSSKYNKEKTISNSKSRTTTQIMVLRNRHLVMHLLYRWLSSRRRPRSAYRTFRLSTVRSLKIRSKSSLSNISRTLPLRGRRVNRMRVTWMMMLK